MAIEPGTLVKVGGQRVPITTMNAAGRFYHSEKNIGAGEFLFGTVQAVYEIKKEVRHPVVAEDGEVVGERITEAELAALVLWAGHRYRTSILPMEALLSAHYRNRNREARGKHLRRRAK